MAGAGFGGIGCRRGEVGKWSEEEPPCFKYPDDMGELVLNVVEGAHCASSANEMLVDQSLSHALGFQQFFYIEMNAYCIDVTLGWGVLGSCYRLPLRAIIMQIQANNNTFLIHMKLTTSIARANSTIYVIFRLRENNAVPDFRGRIFRRNQKRQVRISPLS